MTSERLVEVCAICDHPIVSLSDYINFNDRSPDFPRTFFSHANCPEPEAFIYAIPLRELHRRPQPDGQPPCTYEGWRDHMRLKNWFDADMVAALEQAQRLADWFRPHA